jgi:hypothetical protein
MDRTIRLWVVPSARATIADGRDRQIRTGDLLLAKPDRAGSSPATAGNGQVEAAAALSVLVRWGPAKTAMNGTAVARQAALLGSFSEHLVELGDSASRVLQQRVHERTQRGGVEHVVRNVTVTEVSMWPDPIWPDCARPHRQVWQ